MVTALMVKPGEQPFITQLCDTTGYLNYAVSMGTTYKCTATTISLEKDIAVIFARDGVMFGLEGNRLVKGRIIAGAFYVVKVKNGKLCSLNDDELTRYALRFRDVEHFNDDDVFESGVDAMFSLL